MGIEHLASEKIINEAQSGHAKVKRIDGASCFRINERKFKQYIGDDASMKSGMRKIDPKVEAFEISYLNNRHYIIYDVECISSNGEILNRYFL